MSNGQFKSEFHLNFPTEKMREDFEIAFQAFIKDFQKQQTIYHGLRGIASGQIGGGAGQQGGGQQGGGQQGGGAPHVFGSPGGGQQGGGEGQGLLRIRTAGGTSIYVNCI